MAILTPFVRNPYNYDVDEVSNSSGLECMDISLAVQADADDADINTIVKRFGITGQLPSNVRVPLSTDFTDVMDYHSAMNALIAADEAFMQFPADVRKRFDYDPAKLIEFTEDPANYDEAVKLGIANARSPAPVPAAAVEGAPTANAGLSS